MWRKREKLDFLAQGEPVWQSLTPDTQNTWLVPEHADEYHGFLGIAGLFDLYTVGVKTNPDEVVYDWDREKLSGRVAKVIAAYNAEVHRHKADPQADWPDDIKWSDGLKQNARRGSLQEFEDGKLISALTRPFAKKWIFYDRIAIERTYQWPNIAGPVICLTDLGSEKPFMALAASLVADLHLVGAGSSAQCFPLSHLKDSAVAQFRERYSDDSITKEDIFHYIYALLHHPGYRERYAANLKRELPS